MKNAVQAMAILTVHPVSDDWLYHAQHSACHSQHQHSALEWLAWTTWGSKFNVTGLLPSSNHCDTNEEYGIHNKAIVWVWAMRLLHIAKKQWGVVYCSL